MFRRQKRNSILRRSKQAESHPNETKSFADHMKGCHEQNIVDFTPEVLVKRRRKLSLHLEDSIDRFWCSTGLNKLVLDPEEGICGFVCGSMLYMFAINDDERHFTMSASVFSINPEDDLEKVQATHYTEIKKLATNPCITLELPVYGEIFLQQTVSISLLEIAADEELSEIIDGFLEISKATRKAFKPCRNTRSRRRGILGRLRSSRAPAA